MAFCFQRRSTPVVAVCRIGQVVVHEPVHGRRRQQIALAIGVVAGRVGVHEGGRVDEQLKGGRLGTVTRTQTHRCGQIAASAVTTHGHPSRIDVQAGGVVHHPVKRMQGIVVGGRERVLGGQTVVHRKHGATAGITQLAAQHIVGVDVANHPTTAVVVDQGRQHLFGRHAHGPVFAHRAKRQSMVFADRGGQRVGLRQGFAHQIVITRFQHGQRIELRHATVFHELQQGLGLRVEHGDP